MNCYKCKKILGSLEAYGTVKGQQYCVDCLKCGKCQQPLINKGLNQTVYEKGGQLWCQKCNDEENGGDKSCAFCGKKVTQFRTWNLNPGVIACMDDKCHSELKKPKNYDANAIVKCECGEVTAPAWTWDGKDWGVGGVLSPCKNCILNHTLLFISSFPSKKNGTNKSKFKS